MILCLDFDGTYTADMNFWDAFINKAKEAGHLVFIVTMRDESEGEAVVALVNGPYKKEDNIQIVFTQRKAKKPYMFEWLRKQGYHPQSVIWIDDQPEFLFMDG